jgi:riboflavin kinase / FMN adenylyltransferase
MKIYRALPETGADFAPCALTIGNFDGVHRGHRRILRRVVELAAARGWKPSALTFDPHPTRIVAPHRTPPLMTSPERRAGLMAEVGLEQVLILPFTAAIAHLEPEEFARDILVARLGARAVLVGANFRFGHNHAGDVETLAALGRRLGFETEIVDSVVCRGRTVSSSAVRDLLRTGDVARAARFLERPFSLEGAVVSGRGVGAKETVPTLNLSTDSAIIPIPGVYLTRTHDLEDGRRWNSITNIGYRPTFGASEQLSVETFLLDGFDGRAPRRIRVELLERVRGERRFEDAEALKRQILKDAGVARRYFRRLESWAIKAG